MIFLVILKKFTDWNSLWILILKKWSRLREQLKQHFIPCDGWSSKRLSFFFNAEPRVRKGERAQCEISPRRARSFILSDARPRLSKDPPMRWQLYDFCLLHTSTQTQRIYLLDARNTLRAMRANSTYFHSLVYGGCFLSLCIFIFAESNKVCVPKRKKILLRKKLKKRMPHSGHQIKRLHRAQYS